MRIGEGAVIRVNVPVKVLNADQAPGVKRGGTVNIVTHSIPVMVKPEAIPEAIEVDICRARDQLFQASQRHQAAGRREGGVAHRSDAGHHRAAVGLRRRNAGRQGGCCRGCCRRCRRCGSRRGAGCGRWLRPRVRRLARLLPRVRAGCGWRCSCRGRCCAAAEEVRRRAGGEPCCFSSGLGIPARSYAGNRHNIGFVIVEAIAKRHGIGPWRRRFQGVTAEGAIGGERVLLLLPGTFMNESGRAVAEAMNFYKVPLGRFRRVPR